MDFAHIIHVPTKIASQAGAPRRRVKIQGDQPAMSMILEMHSKPCASRARVAGSLRGWFLIGMTVVLSACGGGGGGGGGNNTPDTGTLEATVVY